MTFAMTTAKVIGVLEKSKKDTIYQTSTNIDLNAKKQPNGCLDPKENSIAERLQRKKCGVIRIRAIARRGCDWKIVHSYPISGVLRTFSSDFEEL